MLAVTWNQAATQIHQFLPQFPLNKTREPTSRNQAHSLRVVPVKLGEKLLSVSHLQKTGAGVEFGGHGTADDAALGVEGALGFACFAGLVSEGVSWVWSEF